MSKRAEEAARDYILTSASPFPNIETAAVIYGYMRAEKELALTWEDLELLHRLFAEEEDNFSKHDKYFYTEVLTRFKQIKEEQQ